MIRVGPAGNPVGYRGSTVSVFRKIRAMGLDAYEYQATYGLRLKKENALKIGENSRKNDILVSMHGPYYINLSSTKEETIEKSIDRLFDCAVAGSGWVPTVLYSTPAFTVTWGGEGRLSSAGSPWGTHLKT